MTSSSHSRFDFGALAPLYDSWYATDEGHRHDAAQKQAVRALLPTSAIRGRCLLDVGCGTGHWSLFFAQQGYEVTGVDICPEMIVEAQARKALRCRFEGADAMDLPFLDESFDVVSAMAMLEFVADARRVCAELIRCLRPGGRLLLGTLNRLAEVNRRRVAEQAEPYVSARLFAPEELRGLLVRFGTVTIRATTEEKSVPYRAPDGPATEEHESEGREASGAMLVARVVIP
jgi:ubiquinone/menaquinone biosynthesis C-methylase UbiE